MCVGNERWTDDRQAMLQEAKKEEEQASETVVVPKHRQLLEHDKVHTCSFWQMHTYCESTYRVTFN